jgi:hypothetical protein
MVIFSTYNQTDDRLVFPFPTGMHELLGVPFLVVQGIFTKDGQKHPDFVRKDDAGYQEVLKYRNIRHSYIPFIGKLSSGSDAIIDRLLEDYAGNLRYLHPVLCPHVTDAMKEKFRSRKIPLRMFDDYDPVQCQEWKFCFEVCLGEAWRYKTTLG